MDDRLGVARFRAQPVRLLEVYRLPKAGARSFLKARYDPVWRSGGNPLPR